MLSTLLSYILQDCKICVWNESGKLIQTIDRTTCGCQWSVDCSAERQLLVNI